jgi:hypothetical protein
LVLVALMVAAMALPAFAGITLSGLERAGISMHATEYAGITALPVD